MADDDALLQLARQVGEATQAAKDARDAARRVEARFSDLPERMAVVEGRVGVLEADKQERMRDRRFFWTGFIAIVTAAIAGAIEVGRLLSGR